MIPKHRVDLFEFMLGRVKETGRISLSDAPQAFARWFAKTYFLNPQDLFVSDGSRDGKIDCFFTTHDGRRITHHIVNSKFTTDFDRIAPPAFYAEVRYLLNAFEHRESREGYLEKAVKTELRPRYRQLFQHFDSGNAEVMFVTNHRCNPGHEAQVRTDALRLFHLDDLLQCLVDDIDGAMPKTPTIDLHDVHGVLSPDKADTEVATSIIFARLIDFIRYMESDPFDLLFNRNVRVAISLSQSKVNKAIRDTFKEEPREFAYSNNGITMLCEGQRYDPGKKVMKLENPRVVNGSQTLHSIRDVPNPSANARVMVRIIEIPPPAGNAMESQIRKRKEVINKIAVRSNQQNPIKNWDLASNDDFQLEVFRYFRNKMYFYERRAREWKLRSRELKSVGIQYGVDIKRLAQLIAAFNWSKAKLGPVTSKKVSELFEADAYEVVQSTVPEMAFQLFLLDGVIWEACNELGRERQYLQRVKSYGYFALCSLVSRCLTEAGAKWGSPSLTETIEAQWKTYYPIHERRWRKLVEACLKKLALGFDDCARWHARKKSEKLTYANFFKNRSLVQPAIGLPIPRECKALAREALVSPKS